MTSLRACVCVWVNASDKRACRARRWAMSMFRMVCQSIASIKLYIDVRTADGNSYMWHPSSVPPPQSRRGGPLCPPRHSLPARTTRLYSHADSPTGGQARRPHWRVTDVLFTHCIARSTITAVTTTESMTNMIPLKQAWPTHHRAVVNSCSSAQQWRNHCPGIVVYIGRQWQGIATLYSFLHEVNSSFLME